MISYRPHFIIWLLVTCILLVSIFYLNNSRGFNIPELKRLEFLLSKASVGDISSLTSTQSGIKRPSEWSCPKTFNKVFKKWTANYRKCLVEQVVPKNTFWKHLHVAIEKCLGETTLKMFDVQFLSNLDDVKLAILPRDPKSDKCTEVTLGIGNDIGSERKLRNLVPHCAFYGADPILASGKIFKEMGTYFEIAVAAENGIFEASVLEGGNYHPKHVTATTLVDFLKTYVNVSQVDYLFMDNEGPEYQLLPQFYRDGLLRKEGLTICQLSIEMHGPFASYGVNASVYDNLVKSMIEQSAFIPLWSTAPQYHVRSFYLNVEDSYCLEKFLQWRFCSEDGL